MKLLAVALILGVVFAGPELNEFGIGNTCNSNGGFTITGFTVSPYPPPACNNPEAVTMTGTFTGNYCPNQINIHEVYNNRQSYDQYVQISGCYTNGSTNTFQFLFTPFQCNSGSYLIQITLQQQNPQTNLACWQYTYTA